MRFPVGSTTGTVFGAAALLLALAAAPSALAGEADIRDASASREPDGTWRISATIAHADTGWDHYADRFEVLAPDGTVLGTRVLLHPHVTEQPFTRSLTGLDIPDGVSEIVVRAHDSVHGYGGTQLVVTLPAE
ncbi:hypothetical protein [Cucumibacter marinus]|uniref:hypothetical protein n=1 Tax=Cucumibacter marinus TaxID=1121252 RepID=UPI0003FEB2A8|nr:hypothetical protein [Cucumibacter marinus]